MILILSQSGDVSTDYVIEWLQYYKRPFVRLNEGEAINIVFAIEFKEDKQHISFCIKGQNILLDEIKGVWFRRGFIECSSAFFEHFRKEEQLEQQIETLLNRENQTLISFLATRLAAIRSLNNQLTYNTNKLLSLMYAQKARLKVPHSMITTTREEIRQAMGDNDNEIITKPIQDIFWLTMNDKSQAQYVATLSDCKFLPDRFYYSLFQEKIKKKWELRIFFIEKDFYACAIFSQDTDGRNLMAGDKLARMVPYNLPDGIKDKLICLNELNGLNCGSIDMIVDVKNDYYFLETNPVGQYGYISMACNYHLDKKIAEHFLYEKGII